ncbi:hypothetical protein DASB73_007080 [Starmerella bacillaris]|uniref:Peptide N-acetyl-beta-D-glucosaminyl asparaginase amidase A N-terminal domain-containing protein n=1 Tax=Starmerella bacillaris TaxID=1247836 RepID=A0AAV5RDZ0_STABA|nr:hypothetical protein DASB73_007080 [Starmerella bacillaris]
MMFLSLVFCILGFVNFGLCESEFSFSISDHVVYDNLVGSQVLLNNFEFSSSWNKPSAVSYNPSVSSSDYNRLVLELNVNTTGTNYDRLVMLFMGDVEVWRSSTPEPDSEGMSWSARKDVSHYRSVFTSNSTINMVIQNNVEGNLDGTFYATLTAYYYNDAGAPGRSDDNWAIDLDDLPSDIVSLNKASSSGINVWYAPSDEADAIVPAFDRSVNRALLHIFASESGEDEFWWQAVSSSAGPSRFIKVYINDTLAGVVTPFPNIFTGGLNPYLWKPIVGLRDFNLPAYFIDITPFLPLLWEGTSKISLVACNGVNSVSVPWSWILSMNLLTWSTAGQVNSGSMNTPKFTNSTSNDTSLLANFELTNSATLNIGGKSQDIQWVQSIDYNNTYSSPTFYQNSGGNSKISGLYSFSWDFNFPLTCESESEYIRVQQTYDAVANGISYYTWIDSHVNSTSSGSFSSSHSEQYLSAPQGAHFASSDDLDDQLSW